MQRLVIFNISNRLKFGQKGQNNLLNFSYFTWRKMVIGTQKHYVLTFVKDSYLVKLEITGNLSKPKNDPLLFFFKSVCPVSLFACFLLFWFDFFFIKPVNHEWSNSLGVGFCHNLFTQNLDKTVAPECPFSIYIYFFNLFIRLIFFTFGLQTRLLKSPQWHMHSDL